MSSSKSEVRTKTERVVTLLTADVTSPEPWTKLIAEVLIVVGAAPFTEQVRGERIQGPSLRTRVELTLPLLVQQETSVMGALPETGHLY